LVSPQQMSFDFLPPIEYTLTVSARARRVYLRVEQGRGLLVTIPKRYPKREIPALVESQREWIQESLDEIEARTPEVYRCWPPKTLNLDAEGLVVSVEFAPSTEVVDGLFEAKWLSDTRLLLCVDQSSRVAVATAMAAALKARAKKVFGPWLAARARQNGLTYKRLGIRGQKTLWGSYSSSGTLSLNYKLLFLPQDLADYVLLHELAHTRHMDHSPEFWQFLDQIKPGAQALDAQLSDAGSLVPPWLELAGKA